MALQDFIRGHLEEIIGEFEAFARTLMPPGSHMTAAELRDHAEEMLTGVVDDLATEQTSDEQALKSKGHGTLHAMRASGHQHADARIEHGFTPAQLLAEFRALRASVLRLYELSGEDDLRGVRRFNEAIDEALTESMSRFGAQTDLYRDQFVGVLGHDLRSPVNAIIGNAALLTMGDTDQRRARIAARILNSGQRMARMIADLLDLTQARLGGMIVLKRSPIDLEHICQEVMLEVQAARPAVVIRFESSGDVTGEWDGDRMAQVVSNLLGNALQHGDGRVVSLRVHGKGDHVVIAVHNSGSPIPPESRRSIFEPLVRQPSGSSEESGSIGLGLFIARAIVTSHGGEIDVASSADEGTTFTIRLPRAA